MTSETNSWKIAHRDGSWLILIWVSRIFLKLFISRRRYRYWMKMFIFKRARKQSLRLFMRKSRNWRSVDAPSVPSKCWENYHFPDFLFILKIPSRFQVETLRKLLSMKLHRHKTERFICDENYACMVVQCLKNIIRNDAEPSRGGEQPNSYSYRLSKRKASLLVHRFLNLLFLELKLSDVEEKLKNMNSWS